MCGTHESLMRHRWGTDVSLNSTGPSTRTPVAISLLKCS